jgi:hypothetical protein
MVAALCLVVNRMLTSEQREAVIDLLGAEIADLRSMVDRTPRLSAWALDDADFYQSIIDELQNGENA